MEQQTFKRRRRRKSQADKEGKTSKSNRQSCRSPERSEGLRQDELVWCTAHLFMLTYGPSSACFLMEGNTPGVGPDLLWLPVTCVRPVHDHHLVIDKNKLALCVQLVWKAATGRKLDRADVDRALASGMPHSSVPCKKCTKFRKTLCQLDSGDWFVVSLGWYLSAFHRTTWKLKVHTNTPPTKRPALEGLAYFLDKGKFTAFRHEPGGWYKLFYHVLEHAEPELKALLSAYCVTGSRAEQLVSELSEPWCQGSPSLTTVLTKQAGEVLDKLHVLYPPVSAGQSSDPGSKLVSLCGTRLHLHHHPSHLLIRSSEVARLALMRQPARPPSGHPDRTATAKSWWTVLPLDTTGGGTPDTWVRGTWQSSLPVRLA